MKVLVVCAHPDDETLGCGGTMLKHVAAGDEVTWIVVTQAHEPAWDPETIARKSIEVERAAEAYGVVEVVRLGFPSSRLDTTPRAELMEALNLVVERVRPDTVYVVSPGDVHGDHKDVYQAMLAILKAFRMGPLGVRRVLAYETLSSTDAAPPDVGRVFIPTVYVDVSDWLERKLEIMGLYETEGQPDPMPRGPDAIRALARYRGATVGVRYAEAFRLVRELA